MGLFDWIRRRKPREEQKAELVFGAPLDYGSRHQQLERRVDPSIEDLPLFHYWHARAMLFDPVVRFGLNVRNSAISCAEVEVTGASEAVVSFVKKQWEFLWGKYSSKLAHTKRYGYGGYEVVYRQRAGQLLIDGLREFSPIDCRPLLVRGDIVGVSVKTANFGKTRLIAPRGLLCTFDAEFNDPYGRSILRRSYSPWWEKWMDGGAVKVSRLRMIKDAYIGDTLTYPMNQKIVLPDGTEVPWRDIIRELGENRLAGGIMALPALFDGQGRELVKYTAAHDTGRPEGIWQWVTNLDVNIWRGMDVFEEVIKASETGSGYSGRSVPLMMFLGACNDEVTELDEAIDRQVLRPLVWLNFGGDPEYSIAPKDLVETFAKKTQGNAMGGGAMGGTGGGQPRQPGQPKEAAGEYIDYRQRNGAMGKRKNPNFGKSGGQQFAEDPEFESKHPRGGDHENPGRFSQGRGGDATTAERPAARVASKTDSTGKPKPSKEEKAAQAERKFSELMASKTPEDAEAFQRARADGIAIPPAWTEVTYYGADKDIRAEGRDDKGRKQRAENPEYRQRVSDENNARISRDLKPRMGEIREQLRQDAMAGNEESKVLYLISHTGFRIGGRGDGKAKVQAFGASTLQGEHVAVSGDTVTFDFPGKKGVRQHHTVVDPVLADMLRDTKPGEKIFSTRDDKVRAAWQDRYGGAKVHDIRHVVATELAERALAQKIPPPPKTKMERKKIIKDVATIAAQTLGNNPSQTLGTYIDPQLWSRVEVAA